MVNIGFDIRTDGGVEYQASLGGLIHLRVDGCRISWGIKEVRLSRGKGARDRVHSFFSKEFSNMGTHINFP